MKMHSLALAGFRVALKRMLRLSGKPYGLNDSTESLEERAGRLVRDRADLLAAMRRIERMSTPYSEIAPFASIYWEASKAIERAL